MASFLGSAHCGDCGLLVREHDSLDFLSKASLLNRNTPLLTVFVAVNFMYNLDPNIAVHKDTILPVFWPEWGTSPEGELLTYSDPNIIHITKDNFRAEAIDLLNGLALELAHNESSL